jgi:tRNA(Glu) U13 pseudouridine synthase TruD
MYVNYFDRFEKTEDENPTIGIILCKDKNETLVELTLPKDSKIFASKYQTILPNKEELKKLLTNKE